ncbi:unnamed protein product, partial [Pleuronectes platessa]
MQWLNKTPTQRSTVTYSYGGNTTVFKPSPALHSSLQIIEDEGGRVALATHRTMGLVKHSSNCCRKSPELERLGEQPYWSSSLNSQCASVISFPLCAAARMISQAARQLHSLRPL